ncbi:hypothetical protein V6N13_139323 [Hibiscus sabdariffa]|uniref:Histidine-containing phosphotransfer protein n=1 Tax=Hibiscus sabdariffa TaxID=183260 RepID=A0ABR2C8G3_9ROSI
MSRNPFAQQLHDHLRNLHDQGILDQNYDHLRSLQHVENPEFVNEVLSMFYHDAPNYIAQITTLLSDDVDYVKVKDVAHQLKGCASSIGGQRMTLVCHQFRNACNQQDKERCLRKFESVKREFNILEESLTTIAQMERDAADFETRCRRIRNRRQT